MGYNDDWDVYEELVSEAICHAKRAGSPVDFRFFFAPPWDGRHAADLTLLPQIVTMPVPVVSIRSGSAITDHFDLTFVVSNEREELPEDRMAARGWIKVGTGPEHTLIFRGHDYSPEGAAGMVCRLIEGLTLRAPSRVFVEGDESGLLRSFLVSTIAGYEGTLDQESGWGELYKDIRVQ